MSTGGAAGARRGGRREVEALLAEFAEHQARKPDNPSPMDLDLIRRELGLEPKSSPKRAASSRGASCRKNALMSCHADSVSPAGYAGSRSAS